ncbi:WhiB family transcriptional regulator [Nakamurella sp. PAMC28650]|uniref:WhiB family transcriptional regulator n=1 Tax=Nakamurella sp. PAMC28650 TaxID=2762325 RepID=UPI00164D62A8|nr:WhiB family transcriptional regulator [Nakamurella sp. PAMC28650]
MTQRRPGFTNIAASKPGSGPRTDDRPASRRINLPALSLAAEQAHVRLGAAIAAARRTPCAGGSDKWFSEDPQVRQEAAESCRGCPVLALCAQYADEAGEGQGVWAGVDRTPTLAKRGRPRKSA